MCFLQYGSRLSYRGLALRRSLSYGCSGFAWEQLWRAQFLRIVASFLKSALYTRIVAIDSQRLFPLNPGCYSRKSEIDAIIRENCAGLSASGEPKEPESAQERPLSRRKGPGAKGVRAAAACERRHALKQGSVATHIKRLDRAAEQQVEHHARKEQSKEGQR